MLLRVAQTQGVDVVYGVRGDRSTDSFFKRSTAGLYYRLMRRLIGVNMPAQAGDFRLLSREAVDVLTELAERSPVFRLLVRSPARRSTRCAAWSPSPGTARPTFPPLLYDSRLGSERPRSCCVWP